MIDDRLADELERIGAEWRASILAEFALPTSGTASDSTAAGPPPLSSAANDFGRTSTRYGFSPVKLERAAGRLTKDSEIVRGGRP